MNDDICLVCCRDCSPCPACNERQYCSWCDECNVCPHADVEQARASKRENDVQGNAVEDSQG